MRRIRANRFVHAVTATMIFLAIAVAGTGCNKDFKITFVPALFDGLTTLSGELLTEAGVTSSAWSTMVNGFLSAIESAIYPEGS